MSEAVVRTMVDQILALLLGKHEKLYLNSCYVFTWNYKLIYGVESNKTRKLSISIKSYYFVSTNNFLFLNIKFN